MSVDPWERQSDEGARAYAAFDRYRELPPHERSINRVVSEFYGGVKRG